jgi:hypothetical protein
MNLTISNIIVIAISCALGGWVGWMAAPLVRGLL